MKANHLNSLLVYEKKDTIEYTNILDDVNFTRRIYEFINSLNDTTFHFVEKPFNKNEKYIEFSIWWKQLQKLKKQIVTKLELETTKIYHQFG
jgi:hypothetical protein